MDWLAFSYSLPGKRASSPRVALWRRLRQLGAVAPKGRVYVLPARDDCAEAFQWLAREVEDAGGTAVLMRVQRFEGISDAEAIEAFQQARAQEYRELAEEAARLEKAAGRRRRAGDALRVRDTLVRLRKRHAEIARIDFFNAPDGMQLLSRLDRLEEILGGSPASESGGVGVRAVADYRASRWVTRPRPYVDRLACAWLIRRFINATAPIRYADAAEPDEVRFDMAAGDFSHRGNLCTFEVMVKSFGLTNPALRAIGELVHEIDLRDGKYARPEAPGIDAVLRGGRAGGLADPDMESRGIALFEGLFLSFSARKKRRVRRT